MKSTKYVWWVGGLAVALLDLGVAGLGAMAGFI